LHGSGRTDAGVHARGQCFHFDAEWLHEPEKLIRALHSILPYVDTHQVCQIGK
jgi:tRNA pseudouridine38-40 synthase